VKKYGKTLNQLKKYLQQALKKKHQLFKTSRLDQQLTMDRIDVTLPGCGQNYGSSHPITRVRQRLEEIFLTIGFDIVTGPELETEEYNFAALNIPLYHPARAVQDTFYLADTYDQLATDSKPCLLRTHTSPVQIRVMQHQRPPVYIIAPGKVYRHDFDPTHTPMFHQLEGLCIDEQANFAQLKGLLITVMQQFFEKDLATRFRPSYFPFTEPSAEMDIACLICQGSQRDCRVCKNTRWLEILGCGIVHPKVLNYMNVDSNKYRGFAFGLGIDRLTMLHYGMDDLRMLFENDVRFLEQF